MVVSLIKEHKIGARILIAAAIIVLISVTFLRVAVLVPIIFKASKEEEYIHLFFGWKNSGGQVFKLMEDYVKALVSANRTLEQGKKLSVPEKFKDIIKLRQGRDPHTLVMDYEKYQRLVNQKAFLPLRPAGRWRYRTSTAFEMLVRSSTVY